MVLPRQGTREAPGGSLAQHLGNPMPSRRQLWPQGLPQALPSENTRAPGVLTILGGSNCLASWLQIYS